MNWIFKKLIKFFFKYYFKIRPPKTVKYYKTQDAARAKVVHADDGSLQMQIEGEDMIFPGFPRGHVLTGPLAKVKHSLKNMVFNQVFEELEKNVKDYGADMMPPEKMVPAVREFHRVLEELENAAVTDKCYAEGNFVLRKELASFEKNLAKFTGTKYALGVASGTDALKLSYKALGLKPGDEVITVSHVFIAPIQEIVHLGAKPILIDVNEDGLMNADLIEPAITKKTVGIVPIHLSGKVCDMDKIMRIAKKHKLWVVEDACQALGAKWKGKSAGSFGDTGCFSHIAPKTLGVGGDGG